MLCRAVILLVIVSCGGSKPPPPATKPILPESPPPEASKNPDQGSRDSAPVATEPVPPKRKPLIDRLHDGDGNVPGLTGFSIQRKPDATHCGGIAIITTRAKKVARADEPIASVFKLEFPTGLDFTTKKEASMKKFNAFVDDMMKIGRTALDHYQGQITTGKDDAEKIAALARIAQISTRLSSLLARAEIPADVRTGDFASEKIEAFCDALIDKAEPIQARAEEVQIVCAEKAKTIAAGWWNEVCVAL